MDTNELQGKLKGKVQNAETEKRSREYSEESDMLPDVFEESKKELQTEKQNTVEPFKNSTIIVSGNEDDFGPPIEVVPDFDESNVKVANESGEEEDLEVELENIRNEEGVFSSSEVEEDAEEYMELLTNIEEQSEKVENMKAKLVKMWAKEAKSREEIVVIKDLHAAIEQESAKLKSLIQRVVEVQQQHSANRYERLRTPTDSKEKSFSS